MTIKNTVNAMREFVAELIYICLMPTLVLLAEHLRIVYFGQVAAYVVLVSAMFSFSFPKASLSINLLLVLLLIDDTLHKQKNLFFR